MKDSLVLFWFRRDLRLVDNAGLYQALRSGKPVLPLFVFDRDILDKLERDDARVTFIHRSLENIDGKLKDHGSSLLVKIGKPLEIWKEILDEYKVSAVFTNHDFEPYARQRDMGIEKLLGSKDIPFYTFKDQVIFEKDEVVKEDGSPYTVYTPYMKKWFLRYHEMHATPFPSEAYLDSLVRIPPVAIPDLKQIGFERSRIAVPEFDLSQPLIANYKNTRDIPPIKGTSMIGAYLRFGLIGIRTLVKQVEAMDLTFLKELIWREFFMQILWHFPHVVTRSFKEQYDRVAWINDELLFEKWCSGKTGYPLVDAGMRQLRETGFMHNRVRMVTASFLCKHLLTDWRWGEAWFAKHLLDYELSSNNGNWQWAAGTGCDAAPYFRVFNPETQQDKFDPELVYIKKWVPEYGSAGYPAPVVDHKMARERAITAYRSALAV